MSDGVLLGRSFMNPLPKSALREKRGDDKRLQRVRNNNLYPQTRSVIRNAAGVGESCPRTAQSIACLPKQQARGCKHPDVQSELNFRNNFRSFAIL